MNNALAIVWIGIVYTITIQLFIILRTLGSKRFEFCLARHVFFRKTKIRGVIVGFERGRWWEESRCPGDYVSVVEYRIKDWRCRTKILRCEEDRVGEAVLLAVSKKEPEKAIRYEKQILYGETNGLSHVYFTILLGIVCDIFLLGLFRVIEVALLILVIVFLLNYLCLPLYLGMRERTW